MSAATFGALLASLRKRHGLSQRELADYVGIAQSTLNMIERADRNPPRKASFYDRLQQVPGVEKFEVAALLQTQDAPAWLIPDQNKEEAQRAGVASEPGVDVELRIHADPNQFTSDELDALRGVVEADVRLTLTDFLRRKAERAGRR